MERLGLSVLALGVVLAGCEPDEDPGDDGGGPLDGVEIDLLEAMSVAAEHVPGGVIIDAELSDEDGDGPIYDVDLYGGDETREITVDAATGKFVADSFDPEDQDDGPVQAAAIASSPAMITLPIAVETAEASADAQAVSAELDVEARRIDVVLYRGEARLFVAIDLDDGTVANIDDPGD